MFYIMIHDPISHDVTPFILAMNGILFLIYIYCPIFDGNESGI